MSDFEAGSFLGVCQEVVNLFSTSFLCAVPSTNRASPRGAGVRELEKHFTSCREFNRLPASRFGWHCQACQAIRIELFGNCLDLRRPRLIPPQTAYRLQDLGLTSLRLTRSAKYVVLLLSIRLKCRGREKTFRLSLGAQFRTGFRTRPNVISAASHQGRKLAGI